MTLAPLQRTPSRRAPKSQGESTTLFLPSVQERVTLCLFGLLVLSCTALLTLVLLNHYSKTSDSSEDYLEDLNHIMEPKTSPCQDFYKYVCGRWDAVHPNDQDVFQIGSRRMNMEFEHTSRRRSLREQDTVYEKIQAGIAMCREGMKNNSDDHDSVVRFLERFGLRTPYHSDELDVPHPVTALVHLALGATVFILFGVHPMVDLRNIDGSMVMAITEQDMFQRFMKMPSSIPSSTPRPGAHPWEARYTKNVQEVHSYIKRNLMLSSGTEPAYVSVRNFTEYTPHIPSDVWIDAFNTIVRPPLHDDTDIFLQTALPLKVVDKILVKFEGRHAKVLNWITYMVQAYFSHPSSQSSPSTDPTDICLEYMTHLAPVAVTKYIYQAVSADKIVYVKRIYHNMKEALPRFYTWLNNLTRAVSVNKFRDMEPVFSKDQEPSRQLDTPYPYVPQFENPFVESLLVGLEGKAAHALHEYKKSRRQTPRISPADPGASAVNLADSTLFYTLTTQLVPLMISFTKNTSLAAWYGRVGPVLGKDILRSFVTKELSNRNDSEDDGREGSQRLSCVLRLYDKEVVMLDKDTYSEFTLRENMDDVASLQLALEVARQDSKRPLEGRSYVKGMTNKQLFFISSCYRFCTFERNVTAKTWKDEHARNDHRCNVPVRTTRDFYEAFGCNMTDTELCDVI